MGLFDRFTDRLVSYGQGVVARVMAPADSARARQLEALERLYRGAQYEGRGLAPSWDKTPVGQRPAPLRSQRPAVQYDLPALLVDRPTSMLFGEGHFPECVFEPRDGGDAADVNAWLAAIIDEGNLPAVALTWARQACTRGSGALTWTVAEGAFEFTAHKSEHLTPTFHSRRAGKLVALEKLFEFRKRVTKVDGDRQYEVDETWLHRETWNEREHVVYEDVPKPEQGRAPTWTPADTVVHGLGFVPGVWVKPIDDGEPATWDGPSLLDGAEDVFADIDRVLGQKARAVFFNQDPLTAFFGLTKEQLAVLHAGGGATLNLPKKTDGADVALMEYSGEGQRVAEEHIQAQRARALETRRVTALDPDKLLGAARSGRALEILHGPMVDLVGELRAPFGRALRELLNQVVRAARERKIVGTLENPFPAAIPPGQVKLQWGPYFPPTAEDLQTLATVAATLEGAGLCDRETLVRWLAPRFGWKDPDAVLERLDQERAKAEAAASAMVSKLGAEGDKLSPGAPVQGDDGEDQDDDEQEP